MLKNQLYKLLGLTLTLAGATACTDTADFDGNANNEGEAEKVVYLEVDLQTLTSGTRADAFSLPTISDGTKVDQLLFCLYQKQEDGSYEPIAGDGQHSVDMTSKSWPYTVRLSLDPEETYAIAFWAQKKSDTSIGYVSPYNTTDLRAIKVNYTDAQGEPYLLNNIEYTDAFFGSLNDFKADGGANRKVYLHRPFAQINIGTSGADYANLIYNERQNPPKVTVTESWIKVKGVANCLNALTGVAKAIDLTTGDDIAAGTQLEAEFGWNTLPAWINSGMPLYGDGPGDAFDSSNPFPFVMFPSGDEAPEKPEEFLTVVLNNNKNKYLFPYRTEYPTFKPATQDVFGAPIAKKYLTEEFKYLSMCYVLVPTTYQEVESGEELEGEEAESPQLEEIGATVAIEYDMRQKIDEKSDLRVIPLTPRELLSVPARANWRTNILGGLNETANPDPTSIFNTYQLQLILQDKFDDPDYNEKYCTATINITRDIQDNDELIITPVNGQEIITKDEDGNNLASITQVVYFIGEESSYTFSVKKDGRDENFEYSIEISSNVDEEEDTTSIYEVEDESTDDRVIKKLILYPKATAVQFYVKISYDVKS